MCSRRLSAVLRRTTFYVGVALRARLRSPRRATARQAAERLQFARRFLNYLPCLAQMLFGREQDRKSTRLNSSHSQISYAVFCLKKKTIYYHRYCRLRWPLPAGFGITFRLCCSAGLAVAWQFFTIPWFSSRRPSVRGPRLLGPSM